MLLTDVSFNLIVAAMGMAVMVNNTQSAVDEALATGTGQYMANVASVVNTYVFDNTALLAASPSGPTTITAGSVTASVADPLHPTIQDLINLQLLSIGFQDRSPLGVSFRVDLTPTNCSAGLTNCTIPGLLYSTTPYRDASGRIRTDQLATVVATAGVDAGVSYAESPGIVTGLAASWSKPNPLAGNQAGVLAMQVGQTSLLAQAMNQYYKRDGSLNLTGPMDASDQAIKKAGDIQSNGSLSASGSASIAGNASIAGTTSTGQLNASNSNIWGNQQVYGNQTVNGALVATNVVYLPALAWSGYGCNGNGITTDPNGQVLSCQSGVWSTVGSATAANASCKSASCNIYLPSYGLWRITGMAYAHMPAWFGGAFYINGAVVDTNGNFGDPEGTGYAPMTGTYAMWGGPGWINASISEGSYGGDGTISLFAVKSSY
ncbi:adhesin [Ralstonia nicotianae]|uniref:adhesin n=1 Tax=Ralstonia pseudosolanacearum TaxID=1310165 RepID=UPI002004DCD6|nr:adhesin [Ralstonia pseudosolanacearum]MCK4118393.1 adhesin [Ralstonia pseudosolanacearum]